MIAWSLFSRPSRVYQKQLSWFTTFLVWSTLSMKMTYSVAADRHLLTLVSIGRFQTGRILQPAVSASEHSKIGKLETGMCCVGRGKRWQLSVNQESNEKLQ